MSVMENAQKHQLWSALRGIDYSSDGNFLVSVEDAGIGRIFSTSKTQFSKQEPAKLQYDKKLEPAAVACSRDKLFVASGTSILQFSLPGGEFTSILTEYTLSVTTVAVNRQGTLVASGCDDHTIRVVAVGGTSAVAYTHHTGPVACVVFDPLGTYLCSAALDGRVLFYDLTSRALMGDVQLTRKSNQVAPPCVRWNPTGKNILATGPANEIFVLKRNEFSVVSTFTGHVQPITAMDYTPNGKYIVSGSLDCKIIVWSVDLLDSIYSESVLAVPLLLRWHPTRDSFALALKNQTLMAIYDLFGDRVLTLKGDCTVNIFDQNVFEDEMEVDEDNGSDLDDFIVDDSSDKEMKTRKEIKAQVQRQARFVPTAEQPRFQPGSTPMYAGKCYLSYNLIGVVFVILQGGAVNSYHVEFHNTTFHRPIQFTDPLEYSLAALSKLAVAFANTNTLYCRLFDEFSKARDWTIEVTDKPVGISLTDNELVLVTDRNLVFLFTLGGIQTKCVSFDGVFLSIASGSDRFMVAAHSASAFGDCQRLKCVIYSHTKEQRDLPISPGSQLSWIGFSSSGLPMSYDSRGTLRALIRDEWIPILDTTRVKAHPQDDKNAYWAVGCIDWTFMAIYCHGTLFPGFPRLALTEIRISPPSLVADQTDWLVSKFLSEHSRVFFGADYSAELTMAQRTQADKCALVLVNDACKSGHYQRALDFVPYLLLDDTPEKAARIAEFFRLPALRAKIEEAGRQKLTRVPSELDLHSKRLKKNDAPFPRSDSKHSWEMPLMTTKPKFNPFAKNK